MAKDWQGAIRREDPASDFYIHLKSQSFLDRRKDVMKQQYSRKNITDVYIDHANYIKSRYMKSRGFLNDLEGNKKYAEEMSAVLDLYASVNSGQMENQISNQVMRSSDEVIKRVQNATTETYRLSEAKSNLKALEEYITVLQNLMDDMLEYDQMAIEYAAENQKENKGRYRVEKTGEMYLTSFNKTGNTSLVNLKKKLDIMKKVHSQYAGTKTDIANIMVPYEGSRGTKSRKFSDLFGGIPTQLTNIQGAVGEAMAYSVAQQGLMKSLQTFGRNTPGVSINMADASIASDKIYNELLGLSGGTSISDTAIQLTPNGAEFSISIGISSKAQFTAKKGEKSKVTSFGTTSVAGILARAQLWDHESQYQLFNVLAPHEKESGDGNLYSKNQGDNLRRYFAARAMKHMLGGLEGETNDTVYFLRYQDSMYPVEEYFLSLANDSSKGSAIPLLNVAGRSSLTNERIPINRRRGETNIGAAYKRSMALRSNILKLTATVTKSL